MSSWWQPLDEQEKVEPRPLTKELMSQLLEDLKNEKPSYLIPAVPVKVWDEIMARSDLDWDEKYQLILTHPKMIMVPS